MIDLILLKKFEKIEVNTGVKATIQLIDIEDNQVLIGIKSQIHKNKLHCHRNINLRTKN